MDENRISKNTFAMYKTNLKDIIIILFILKNI